MKVGTGNSNFIALQRKIARKKYLENDKILKCGRKSHGKKALVKNALFLG